MNIFFGVFLPRNAHNITSPNNPAANEAPIIDSDGATACARSSIAFVEYEIPVFSTNRPPVVTVDIILPTEEIPSSPVIFELKLIASVPSEAHI